MKTLRSFRIWACAACLLVAAILAIAPAARAISQSTNQVIMTLLGTEQIQVYSQVNNTAAIAYTTTASLRDGRMYLYNVPVTSFTITLTPTQSAVILNPAGTLAAGAIVMPPTGVDGKLVTIYTTQTITALTLSTSNSATFTPAAITTLAANTSVAYVYNLAGNVWYRMQ